MYPTAQQLSAAIFSLKPDTLFSMFLSQEYMTFSE